jgi:hypothetical protein
LPIFSGEEKSEISFDVWKLEVKCVLREGNYTGSSVLQAIRGSLKGKARSLLLSLSEHATDENIIDILDGAYGNVLRSFFFKMSSSFLESDDIGWCCTVVMPLSEFANSSSIARISFLS